MQRGCKVLSCPQGDSIYKCLVAMGGIDNSIGNEITRYIYVASTMGYYAAYNV
jgi:hypothetical protein